ncbi:MAG: tRNA preQ1(34) S-adenosylmethionine ribosyltransferase-isomerase QueA [Desulfarculus sp.]|nr:MAG: tRNA preQ1(34) S-adenosylmethionine ribosyltransferase-isomerase QueA [Desulfarculus sp.]
MILASPKSEQGCDPLAAYDYHLPPGLIAQGPARRRVQARLMLLGKNGGGAVHEKVARLTRLLRPGDLLVLNQTQVVPARLLAYKPSGGRVEVLLLSPAQPLERLAGGGELHQCLLRSHRPLGPGARLLLRGQPELWLEVRERRARGQAVVEFPGPALAVAQERGQTPLPPYIKRPLGPGPQDRERYQTVYAACPGAVAAPTAGLHLSRELLAALGRRGVEMAALTLHVGYGTFAEPSAADLAAGRLHAEWVETAPALSQAVARTKARGGRVIAVGTTSLRALEWRVGPGGVPQPGQGWCDLLIAPGHEFRVTDGLLTNFHLPRTTLLMLVAALAGRERVLEAYAEAVTRRYRFYSFGDAMLII